MKSAEWYRSGIDLTAIAQGFSRLIWFGLKSEADDMLQCNSTVKQK